MRFSVENVITYIVIPALVICGICGIVVSMIEGHKKYEQLYKVNEQYYRIADSLYCINGKMYKKYGADSSFTPFLDMTGNQEICKVK